MSSLTVDDSDPHFQVPVDTVLFSHNKIDKLFKKTVKSHKNSKTKINYTSWDNIFDEWVSSRSMWAYAQFISLLSNTKKIPRDIAARIDEIVMTGKTETSSNNTEGSLGASNKNPIEQPDLETICKKQIQTLRYIPIKFRLSWSDVFTRTTEECFSKAKGHRKPEEPICH